MGFGETLGRVLINRDWSADRCPLYPQKRTCAVQLGMSALDQKRTLQPSSLYRFNDACLPGSQEHPSDVNQSPVGFLQKCHYYSSVLPRDYVGRAKQMETEHGRTTWVVCHSLGWQQQPFFYFSEPPSRLSNNSHHQHLHHPVMARRLRSNRRRLPLPRPQPKVRTTVGTMFSLSLMAAAILSLLRNPTSLAMPRSI